jgi:hypothetical protein
MSVPGKPIRAYMQTATITAGRMGRLREEEPCREILKYDP